MYIPNVICLILLGCLFLQGCKNASQSPFGAHPQSVHVAEVVQRETPLYLEVVGRIDSPVKVSLRAQVNGRLSAIHVGQGDEVKAGDLLFTIDPAPFQADVDQAMATLKKDEASLAFAKAKLERYKPLVKQDYVSQLHYDQYTNDVETLTAQTACDKAALERAQINLGYCKIRAPMDGKLSQARSDPGNLVGPSDAIPLTELRRLDPIDVRFSLAQKDFQTIKATHRDMDLAIGILLPGEKEPSHFGKVYFIDNHLDLGTGTILCKGQLANSDRSLWPGEFVRVRLMTKVLPQALLVPEAAIQVGQEGPYLYIVKTVMENDQPQLKVEMRNVEVQAKINGFAILAEGIKVGDQVVIEGQINLKPDSLVAISKPEDNK